MGCAWSENKWLPTRDRRVHAHVWVALSFAAKHAYQLHNVVAVRLGRIIQKLNVLRGYDSCFITAWKDDIDDAVHVDSIDGMTSIKKLLGQNDNTSQFP